MGIDDGLTAPAMHVKPLVGRMMFVVGARRCEDWRSFNVIWAELRGLLSGLQRSRSAQNFPYRRQATSRSWPSQLRRGVWPNSASRQCNSISSMNDCACNHAGFVFVPSLSLSGGQLSELVCCQAAGYGSRPYSPSGEDTDLVQRSGLISDTTSSNWRDWLSRCFSSGGTSIGIGFG